MEPVVEERIYRIEALVERFIDFPLMPEDVAHNTEFFYFFAKVSEFACRKLAQNQEFLKVQ